LKRVLLACDGSPVARRALARTCAIASPEAVVTVISVLHSPGSARGSMPTANRARRSIGYSMRLGGSRVQHGIDATALAPVGAPARRILAAARRTRADVIVVGRGRGRLPHIGSISGELVRRASDVLVVQAGAAWEDGSDKG
jgi:nucleotide-binding universal stress UspA family protein